MVLVGQSALMLQSCLSCLSQAHRRPSAAERPSESSGTRLMLHSSELFSEEMTTGTLLSKVT